MSLQQSAQPTSPQGSSANYLAKLTPETRSRIYKLLLSGKIFGLRLTGTAAPKQPGQPYIETRPLRRKDASPDAGKKSKGKKKKQPFRGHSVQILQINKDIYKEALPFLYGANAFKVTHMNDFEAFTRRPTNTGLGNPISGYDNVARPGIEHIRHIELLSAGRISFDFAMRLWGPPVGIQSLKIAVSKEDAEQWPGCLFDTMVACLQRFTDLAQRAELLGKIEFVPKADWVPRNSDNDEIAEFEPEQADQVIHAALARSLGVTLD